jgi:hypothetical protein
MPWKIGDDGQRYWVDNNPPSSPNRPRGQQVTPPLFPIQLPPLPPLPTLRDTLLHWERRARPWYLGLIGCYVGIRGLSFLHTTWQDNRNLWAIEAQLQHQNYAECISLAQAGMNNPRISERSQTLLNQCGQGIISQINNQITDDESQSLSLSEWQEILKQLDSFPGIFNPGVIEEVRIKVKDKIKAEATDLYQKQGKLSEAIALLELVNESTIIERWRQEWQANEQSYQTLESNFRSKNWGVVIYLERNFTTAYWQDKTSSMINKSKEEVAQQILQQAQERAQQGEFDQAISIVRYVGNFLSSEHSLYKKSQKLIDQWQSAKEKRIQEEEERQKEEAEREKIAAQKKREQYNTNYVGTWQGEVNQTNPDDTYPATLNLNIGEVGEIVGNVKYHHTSLGSCEFTLRLEAINDDSIEVREMTRIGPNYRCSPGTITLYSKGKQEMVFAGDANGFLKRK